MLLVMALLQCSIWGVCRSFPIRIIKIRIKTQVTCGTGKSLSEALIFVSTNPQYDDRLFIKLQVQYMKIPSSEHGENMLWTEIVFDIQNNFCTKHVLPMFCKKKSFCQRFTFKRCIIFLKNLIDLCFVVFQLFNSNLPNLITVRTKCRVCCLAYWPLCRVANQSHLWF